MTITTTEHEAKVRECLDMLQEAQNLVNQAAQSLCSVPGFASEWGALSEPYQVIKANWHKVEARRVRVFSSGRRPI
jgi:hypothetical protein